MGNWRAGLFYGEWELGQIDQPGEVIGLDARRINRLTAVGYGLVSVVQRGREAPDLQGVVSPRLAVSIRSSK